ncbi:MAG: exodeoxyribonuclease VII large subunit [Pseudomonadota bacterium]
MADFFANADSSGTNVAEFSVSELSGAIKRTVEDAFGRVRVRGELGRVSRPASGHVYLDLKDDRAVIAGVIWKGAVSKLPIKPEEGLEVIATGRITTFPGQSKYQIVIDHLEPAGAGALMALLEERKKRLAAEGLFDETRKKALPYLPTVIGVVTSPTGSVIRDILHRLNDRFPVHVIVWPVRVQGETSAGEVARGIVGFNALEPGDPIQRPDLLIVARGGGSVEDLWCFNEEIVARAAAMSDIPLISAIGHETDTTLIDYVADRRAPTPTGAAEMAVPVKAELEAYVAQLGARLQNALTRQMDNRRERLRSSARGLPAADALLAIPRQKLDGTTLRLGAGLDRSTSQKRLRLTQVAAKVSLDRLGARVSLAGGSLRQLQKALPLSFERYLSSRRQALQTRARLLSPYSVARKSVDGREKLSVMIGRLDRATARQAENANANVGRMTRLLHSLSYKNVLSRGFSLVRNASGQPVRSGKEISVGVELNIEFGDQTRADVIVSGGSKTPKNTKRRQATEDDREQGSLL